MLDLNTLTVGQLIVGVPENGFAVTNEDCLMQVTEVDRASLTFKAKIVAIKSKKYKDKIGCEYGTDEGMDVISFRLATSEDSDRIKGVKAPKPKSKKINLGILKISLYENGMVESNFNAELKTLIEVQQDRLNTFAEILAAYDGSQKSIRDFKNINLSVFDDILSTKNLEKTLDNLINFFIEFQFTPSMRFINTLGLKLINSTDDGLEYIKNYFRLSTSPFVTAVEDKMKSPEFKTMMNYIALSANPSNKINERLKVYYGAQGTGKTTRALEESEGRNIVCNNSMLPQDLLEDFKFTDGKPGFNKSIFRECIEEGKLLTLDEGNLLPFETIRFLQGILDGKKSFIWKGEEIKVAEGFGVIITMNLTVNGTSYGLPEPLIDRCSDIQEFKLSGKQLMAALV